MSKYEKYYPDYDHLAENRSMPFADIALSCCESFWLSMARRFPISLKHAARLIDLGLVEELTLSPSAGGMPIRTDTFRISSRGIAYRNYHIRDCLRYRFTTFIALAALIKSFLPEILELLAWLSMQLKHQ